MVLVFTAMLTIQSAAPGDGAPVAPTSPIKADTRDHVSACAPAAAEDGDIVVCGHKDRDELYRLRPLAHRYDPVPGPGVGFKVGEGHANVYSTSQQSPDGKPDKRVMTTLKLPF